MPMFDFLCPKCEHQFEELVFGDEKAICPNCGEKDIERMVSAPSPLKTGAFPFKVGPVHSRVGMQSNLANPPCNGACSRTMSNES